MNSWKDLNPQWEYKLWDEQNIKELNFENLMSIQKNLIQVIEVIFYDMQS